MHSRSKGLQVALILLIVLLLGSFHSGLLAETKIIRSIVYHEIFDAQISPIAKIERLKMSKDGSKIVFNTVGGELYTINSDGTELTKIMASDGRGYIDISSDGSVIIFARHFGYEILVFDSNGGQPNQIANNLPLPAGGTTGPDIRLNPVIADGTEEDLRIFFTAVADGADVAGVWSVKPDGSDLTQHFSYRQMSQQLFGLDGNEFNPNVAFQQGFAASENGRRTVVGTFNFHRDGHTIAWGGMNGLSILRDFAPAESNLEQGLAISSSGDTIIMTQGLPERTAVLALNFDGTNQTEILQEAGGDSLVQITNGSIWAFVRGDSVPLVLLNTNASGRLDLVNSPCLGIEGGDPFFRNSIGPTVSISRDGRRFAFVSALNFQDYSRIWVADIEAYPVEAPAPFSDVDLSPNYILTDGSNDVTFTATLSGAIQKACFDGYRDGVLDKDAVRNDLLFDDGTTAGDVTAGDGIYTNNAVSPASQDAPEGPAEIRFAAQIEGRVTAVEAAPFFILGEAPAGSAPIISSLSPTSGQPGTQITINGTGFDPQPNHNVVLIGNHLVYVSGASANQILFIIPQGLPTGLLPVVVYTNGLMSNITEINVTGGGCKGDYDKDGDCDGSDLFDFKQDDDPNRMDSADFALNFGNDECESAP